MDDFAPGQGIDWKDSVVGMVRYGGGDKSMVVMFYNKPVHQPAESAEKGREIYKDQVFVRIHPPGERLNIIDRPAQQSDAQRWPIQWAAFKQNQQQIPEGTPIEQLYPDKPSISATLRAYGVHTIEMCAELSANAIDTIGMGAQTYCNDAQKYLEVANKGVNATQMRRELEQRDTLIARLQADNASLKGQLDHVLANQQNQPTLDQIQQMIAGVMQRPVYNPGVKADPQTAMINANHKTADISKAPPKVRVRQRGKTR